MTTLNLLDFKYFPVFQCISSSNGVCSCELRKTNLNVFLQVDERMQRVLAKERSSQSKALDLQSQLSRAKTELSQLQRNKEEVCLEKSVPVRLEPSVTKLLER